MYIITIISFYCNYLVWCICSITIISFYCNYLVWCTLLQLFRFIATIWFGVYYYNNFVLLQLFGLDYYLIWSYWRRNPRQIQPLLLGSSSLLSISLDIDINDVRYFPQHNFPQQTFPTATSPTQLPPQQVAVGEVVIRKVVIGETT